MTHLQDPLAALAGKGCAPGPTNAGAAPGEPETWSGTAKSRGSGCSESADGSVANRTGGGTGSVSLPSNLVHDTMSVGPSANGTAGARLPGPIKTHDLPRMSYWFDRPAHESEPLLGALAGAKPSDSHATNVSASTAQKVTSIVIGDAVVNPSRSRNPCPFIVQWSSLSRRPVLAGLPDMLCSFNAHPCGEESGWPLVFVFTIMHCRSVALEPL